MTDPAQFAARLAAVEIDVARLHERVDAASTDAAAARHLAAARDRDLADLGIKVDANRSAINALGVQTASGFAEMRETFGRVDHQVAVVRAKFDEVDRGFAEMRGRFDQMAAGMAQIVELLTDRDGR